MNERRAHCCVCFSIQDVQPMREIYLQDDGMRAGHYFAVYAHGRPQLLCGTCRHRRAAFERLIGIQQRRGEDVHWLDEKPNDR